MLREPYIENRKYGDYLKANVAYLKKYIIENDDDFMIITIGDRSTGKSTWSLHFLEEYMDGQPHIKQVCGSREKFANSYYEISHGAKPRALVYDEANVNKRRAMASFNTDLLDQYYSNRGLNMLHIWCNPSLDMIDHVFINELIKGVVFFPTGNKKLKNFRYYYYFHKDAIKKIYDKFGKLDLDILSKCKEKYAWYMGWFRDYDGILKKAYLVDKDARMKDKAKQFQEKYGDDGLLKRGAVAKELGVNIQTIYTYMSFLTENVDYYKTITGHYQFTPESVDKLRGIITERARVNLERSKQNG